MKKLYGMFTASILMCALACAAAIAASSIQGSATISSIQGDVQVQSGKGGWTVAREGGILRTGDKVKTGAKSSCVIKWSGGNTVKLTSFTAVSVDKLEKTPSAGAENSSIGMYSGKVYANAKKLNGAASSFEVKTPSAVAGVRGTKLAVGLDTGETTTVECLEGAVHVTGRAGGEVDIAAGQKTVVPKDAAPQQPQTLGPEDQQGFTEIDTAAGASLEIMEPVGDLETGTTPILVRGMTDPLNIVAVNGKTVTADLSGNFSVSVDLVVGVNHVKIDASNNKGNVTTKTRVIKYTPGFKQAATQTSAPAGTDTVSQGQGAENAINLIVTSPQNGYVTRQSSVVVSGTCKPGTDLTINDTPVPVSPGSGAFSATVQLIIQGDNPIVIKGSKGANSQTVTRTVTLDTLAPMLIVIQPSGNTFGPDSPGCTLSGSFLMCTIVGLTEYGVTLTVGNAMCNVRNDGSFGCPITISSTESTINVAATDRAGNRTSVLLSRAFDRTKVDRLEVSVSPSSIVADMQSTAVVTVRAYNFMSEPVTATVNLTATTGGTLSPQTVTTAGGVGTVTFRAGAGSVLNTVTITAAYKSITASTTLILLPDIPPPPGQ